MDIIHLLFGVPVLWAKEHILFLNKCYTMRSVLHLKSKPMNTSLGKRSGWRCRLPCVVYWQRRKKNKKYNSHRHININTKRVASGTELFIPNFRASILKLYIPTHQNVTFRGCWVRSNARFVISESMSYIMEQKIYLLSSTCTAYS